MKTTYKMTGVVLTDEMLDEMAREYEDGTWSGHGKVSAGRARIYDEDGTWSGHGTAPASQVVADGTTACTNYDASERTLYLRILVE